MTYLLAHLAIILSMISQVLGVLGAFLMANRYTNVYWYQVPTILIAALWRGKSAKDAAALVDLGRNRKWPFFRPRLRSRRIRSPVRFTVL